MQDLERFVAARGQSGTYEQALAQLRAGRKRSHWIGFVFPQIAGLGMSSNSRFYALRDLNEARAYLIHPVLGPRLRECTEALLELDSRDPVAVLGGIDATKLRSSMTLFAHAAPDDIQFRQVLEQFFGGKEDGATLALL